MILLIFPINESEHSSFAPKCANALSTRNVNHSMKNSRHHSSFNVSASITHPILSSDLAALQHRRKSLNLFLAVNEAEELIKVCLYHFQHIL